MDRSTMNKTSSAFFEAFDPSTQSNPTPIKKLKFQSNFEGTGDSRNRNIQIINPHYLRVCQIGSSQPGLDTLSPITTRKNHNLKSMSKDLELSPVTTPESFNIQRQTLQFAPSSVDANFQKSILQIKKEFKGIFQPGTESKTTRSTRGGGAGSMAFSQKRNTLNPMFLNSGGTQAFQDAFNPKTVRFERPSNFLAQQFHTQQNFNVPGSMGKIMLSVNDAYKGKELPSVKKKIDGYATTGAKFDKKRTSLAEKHNTIRYHQSFGSMLHGSSDSSFPYQPTLPLSTLASQESIPKVHSNKQKMQEPPDSRDSLRNQRIVLKEKLNGLERLNKQIQQQVFGHGSRRPSEQTQSSGNQSKDGFPRTEKRNSKINIQCNGLKLDQLPSSLKSSNENLSKMPRISERANLNISTDPKKRQNVQFKSKANERSKSPRSPRIKEKSKRNSLLHQNRLQKRKLDYLKVEKIPEDVIKIDKLFIKQDLFKSCDSVGSEEQDLQEYGDLITQNVTIQSEKSEDAIKQMHHLVPPVPLVNEKRHPKNHLTREKKKPPGEETGHCHDQQAQVQRQNDFIYKPEKRKKGAKVQRFMVQSNRKLPSSADISITNDDADGLNKTKGNFIEQMKHNQSNKFKKIVDAEDINDTIQDKIIKSYHLNRIGLSTAENSPNKKPMTLRKQKVDSSSDLSIFEEKYPAFVRGITPVHHGNMSDMDPVEREELQKRIEQQKQKQNLYRKGDFELIEQRQEQFKDLMELSVYSFKDSTAIVPVQRTDTEIFEHFPFQKKGKGDCLAAYNNPKLQLVQNQAKFNLESLIRTEYLKKSKLNLSNRDIIKINKTFEKPKDVSKPKPSNPLTQQQVFFQKMQEHEQQVVSDKNQAIMVQFLDYVTNESYQQNVIQIQNKLEDQVLNQGFKGYQQLADPMTRKFTKYVQDRKAFYNLMKNMNTPKAQEGMEEDPHYNFIKNCDHDMVHVISLLQKINDGSLNLIGYQLNDTYCRALRDAFMSKNFMQSIHTVQLDGNGISSDGINMLLDGIVCLPKLTRFVYKNNKLDSAVPMGPSGSLRSLLLKPEPNNLDELRITNCKLQSYVVEEILTTVMEDHCQLRKLGLVNVGMTKPAAELVMEMLETQMNIIDLDISYNHLTPNIMYFLSECLSRNRNLQYLNVSWNNFKELYSLKMYDEAEEMDDIYEMEVAQNLCKFIKYNQNLLHVDLSNTGLTKRMLIEFGSALRKARSLVCLHLSGNTGLCSEFTCNDNTQKEEELNKFLVENKIVKNSFLQPIQKYDEVFQHGMTTVANHLSKVLVNQDDLKDIEIENRDQVKEVKTRNESEIVKKNSILLLQKKVSDPEILKIIEAIDYNNERSYYQKEQVRSIRNFINLKEYLKKRVVCVPKFDVLNIDVFQQDNLQKLRDGLNIKSQFQNGLKTREYYDHKQNNQKSQLKPIVGEHKNKLIFDRFLGHKHDIGKGSGQWRLQTQMQENCWVCEGLVYSIIFWNQNIGAICEDQVDETMNEMMVRELETLQKKVVKQLADGKYTNKDHRLAYHMDVGLPHSQAETPVIQGPFSNWHPQKMIPIEEYCDIIDKHQPNFIGILKRDEKCRKEVYEVDDLNPQELEDYDILKARYMNQYYTKNFHKVIEKSLEYKQPNLVFNEYLTQYNKDSEKDGRADQNGSPGRAPSPTPFSLPNTAQLIQDQPKEKMSPNRLFVFATFMKPGKHYFMVRLDPEDSGTMLAKKGGGTVMSKMNLSSNYGDESACSWNSKSTVEKTEPKYYSHVTIAPFRSEEIPVNIKTYGSVTTEHVFKKNNSVFRDWKENTDKILNACAEHDFTYWKIPKMPKFKNDPEEFQRCKDIIRKHIEVLSIIHLYYASENNFPYAGNYNIQTFVNQFNIAGGMPKDFKGQIDTNMKSAFTGRLQGTLENSCIRFQFLEFIVRMGISKYLDSKPPRASAPSDAVKQFIRKDILPYADDIREKWDGFRQSQLWTMDVNEVFEANMHHIKALMEKFYQPRAKFLEMKDAVEIFSRHCELITEVEAKYIYGMSKMMNPNESKEINRHRRMTCIAELVEMIARAADLKYRSGTPESGKPLGFKIGLVLDRILALIGQKHVTPKKKEADNDSQSDEDY